MSHDVEMEIQKILNNLNYTKISIVMNLLGWKWRNEGVPDEFAIRKEVRRIMEYAWDYAQKESRNGEWVYTSSGGIIVWCCRNDKTNTPLFQVSFAIDTACNLE